MHIVKRKVEIMGVENQTTSLQFNNPVKSGGKISKLDPFNY